MLFTIGLLLLLPLLGVGVVQWQISAKRVEAAGDVSVASAKLETLVRLRSGLSAEQISSSWRLVNGGFVGDFPRNGAEMVGVDFAESYEQDRNTVNRHLADLGDPALTEAVAMVRNRSAGTTDIETLGAEYDDVIELVIDKSNRELQVLIEAATGADSTDVAVAAQVAEAAARVEISSGALGGGWASVAAAPFIQPYPAQVRDLADVVAVYEDHVRKVEQIVPTSGPVAEEWAAFVESDARRNALAIYEETIMGFVRNGVPEPDPTTEGFDLTGTDLRDVLELAAEMNESLGDWRVMTAEVGRVVDASLLEVREAADRSLADASRDQNVTVGWILVTGVIGIGATIALMVLVARPLQRLADTAQELGKGRLATRLEERGPAEIRVSARALNEAMASLQTAEAQAIALAEERLDDLVISAAAPGQLGASLHAAVTRLARNLAEREQFQQRLAHEAAHDGLTKLPNRNAVLRHLDSAIARTRRSETSLALLFIDLDEFKAINDRYGHQAGDKVLQETARRLLASIRDGDLAGRLGGDEFLVVAEPIAGIHEVSNLAERIQENVTRPIVLDGVTVVPKISVGIGLADGSLSAEELLRDADLAVYRAKSMGKGTIDICDENLRGEVRARDEMELAIRQALDNDLFELHYQASVNAATKEVTAFEALLRWDRPGYGRVPPDVFIPVAERTELIVDIDRWVLNAAVAQLKEWADHPDLADVMVAINISSRHLGSGQLNNDVRAALETHGVDPQRLSLEVTETAILEDMIAAGRELSALRDHGVQISLDDFGTGYMSLAHLRGLPVDSLKIDGSFVAAMEDDADYTLIHLIVKTGHLLNVTITAEGVETERQATLLTEMGCDSLQGFLYSRPVSAAATEVWMADHRPVASLNI
ncbi:MAG: EAL domain-containing protein [Actinomycetota bacterium]